MGNWETKRDEARAEHRTSEMSRGEENSTFDSKIHLLLVGNIGLRITKIIL